jgi:hypothetical protein
MSDMSTGTIPATFARRTTTLFPADAADGLYYRIHLNLAGRVDVSAKDRDDRANDRQAVVELSTVLRSLGGPVGARHLQAGLYRIPLSEQEFTAILGWR